MPSQIIQPDINKHNSYIITAQKKTAKKQEMNQERLVKQNALQLQLTLKILRG